MFNISCGPDHLGNPWFEATGARSDRAGQNYHPVERRNHDSGRGPVPVSAANVYHSNRFSRQCSRRSCSRTSYSGFGGGKIRFNFAMRYCDGGTYSCGRAEPSPKKNCSICSTRNCWAWGVHG